MTTVSRLRIAVLLAMGSLAAGFDARAQGGAPPSGAAAAPAANGSTVGDTLTGAAKDDYSAGKQLVTDKDFGGALMRFTRAYEQSHDARILLDMATCEQSLQHAARTISLAEQALGAGPALSPSETARARELVNALQGSVSRIRMTVNQPGATILVDGKPVGQTPLGGELAVDLGTRQISVTKPGFREFSTSMTANFPGHAALDVKLQPDVAEGQVHIHTAPKNAVTIDGVTAYGNWGGPLAAGPHSLVVSGAGMKTYETRIQVEPNKTKTLDVTLDVEGMSPVWLWVTGGAVLVASAVVAGTVVFQSSH
jgi:hypothetical protein